MKERIKKLRKTLDITQQEFAQRIGSVQNSIASYEIGRRLPSNAVIDNICKTFHVDEKWLRTGEGEMFIQKKPQPLDELLSDLLDGETVTDEDRILVKNFLELPDDSRKEVIKFVQKCAVELSAPALLDIATDEEKSRIAAEIKAGREQMEVAEELLPEEQEELERIRQEMIAKRGQTGQPSVLPNASAG